MSSAPAADSSEHRLEKSWIDTQEKVVNIGGVEFKEVEYQGEIFRFRARQAETNVDCQKVNLPEETFAADASVKVAKHTRAFLEVLRQRCDGESHAIVVSPDIFDANLGVQFEGERTPSGEKKGDKKIFVNPSKQMGSASFGF